VKFEQERRAIMSGLDDLIRHSDSELNSKESTREQDAGVLFRDPYRRTRHIRKKAENMVSELSACDFRDGFTTYMYPHVTH